MPRRSSRLWSGAVASIVFLAVSQLPDLFRWVGVRRFITWPISLGLRNALEVAIVALGVMFAHRFGLRRAAGELGLRRPIGRGLGFALLATFPMLIAFAAAFHLNPDMTPFSIGVLCFAAPFAEEVVFRGYLFRQLYRRARLGFWLSALIPSVLFAAGHLYQSNDRMELVGIVAITGSGSLGFCWAFVRWQDNIWPVFALHSLMNLWWEVFAVDTTALGGWLANAARGATILLALLLTIYRDRIWKPGRHAEAGGPDPGAAESGPPGHRRPPHRR